MIITIPENRVVLPLVFLPLDVPSVKVVYETNAQADVFYFSPSGQKVKQQIRLIFQGNGSRGQISGLITNHHDDVVQTNLTVLHQGQATTCDVLVRGILYDRALVKFTGLLRVEPGAKQTNTYLRTDFLLMSSEARAVAIPSLEIMEHELERGGHAATISKIDEEQLFYLQSRGIERAEGKKLLIQGFLQTVLGRIKDRKQRAEMQRKIFVE